ncbi:Hypothetical protein FKW44_002707, partial [Caligus rogercresseyi]
RFTGATFDPFKNHPERQSARFTDRADLKPSQRDEAPSWKHPLKSLRRPSYRRSTSCGRQEDQRLPRRRRFKSYESLDMDPPTPAGLNALKASRRALKGKVTRLAGNFITIKKGLIDEKTLQFLNWHSKITPRHLQNMTQQPMQLKLTH